MFKRLSTIVALFVSGITGFAPKEDFDITAYPSFDLTGYNSNYHSISHDVTSNIHVFQSTMKQLITSLVSYQLKH